MKQRELDNANLISLFQTCEDRDHLYEEMHSRPSADLSAPLYLSHLGFLNQGQATDTELELISALCKRFSVNPPASDAVYFDQDFGGFHFRWEKHTEFSTYTFNIKDNGENLPEFGLSFIPTDWLESIPGKLLIAVHAKIDDSELSEKQSHSFFEGQRITASKVANRKATVRTSFRVHSDGFARYHIANQGLNEYQLGRLAQRILELETYRLMTLLGLPVARQLLGKLQALEAELAALTQKVADMANQSEERKLLAKISRIAANIERYQSESNYRFSATGAYYSIVEKRLDQVFEERISGFQTMKSFLDRRLRPAVDTCKSVLNRLEDLSRQTNRTTSLLRTRVEVSIESQNQKLLSSMDKRAAMQLRLQQTVEGLSVVAISYYVLSLAHYGFTSLEEFGLPIDNSVATGLALPIVFGAVFVFVRRHMKKLKHNETEHKTTKDIEIHESESDG